MTYTHRNQGTCSTYTILEVEDGVITGGEFISGCNGNLKAIMKLVKGMKLEDVAGILEGNTCGFRSTSCADQLAETCKQILNGSLKGR